MEKMLLTKLEPKEKEHQRKKLLRLFFACFSKRIYTDALEERFWKWVRTLNPDNVNSEERYKSMSYEFLDKLLSQRMFRERFLPWLQEFESELGTSEEDCKALAFVKFIKQSVSVKADIEEGLSAYLTTLTSRAVVPVQTVEPLYTQSQPNLPGLYYEAKCSNPECILFRTKTYVYVGLDGVIDYFRTAALVQCSRCKSRIQAIIDIGTLECISAFTGRSKGQGGIQGDRRISLGYATFDEIHIYQWEELKFEVLRLTEDQRNRASSIILAAFEDPVIPKKRYKRRNDVTVSTSPTPSVVEVKTKVQLPTLDYRGLLTHMDKEVEQEALKNAALKEELQMLRKTLETLTAEMVKLL